VIKLASLDVGLRHIASTDLPRIEPVLPACAAK